MVKKERLLEEKIRDGIWEYCTRNNDMGCTAKIEIFLKTNDIVISIDDEYFD